MKIFPKRAGIRLKLITIFILVKVIPLLSLAWLIAQAIPPLSQNVSDKIDLMANEVHTTALSVGELALKESVDALDNQAQEAIERQTGFTAAAVADFLYSIDRDISAVSKIEPSAAAFDQFINSRTRLVPEHAPWKINEAGDAWVASKKNKINSSIRPRLAENEKEFHYRAPNAPFQSVAKPQYLEITYFDTSGQELFKATSSDIVNDKLVNVSNKANTWIKAETYFDELANLNDDEIYVSDVIGAYVSSPIIGAYTPEKAKAKGLEYKPETAAYAGKENPVGKRFQGLIRWVRPVVKNGKRVGYVSLALDHLHLMNFTDHLLPTKERFSDISDASSGNYAFMWDYKGRNISHPRDYFIVGYNPETGEQVPSWLDKKTHDDWLASGQSFEIFSQTLDKFEKQSLLLKPALSQIASGQTALDCQYLNFAPQCSGWWDLTQDGGSGSFELFWSGIWKLTTAAAIPYTTGQYGSSNRGFGFVTIGANVHEFHLAATKASTKIDTIIERGDKKLVTQQAEINDFVMGGFNTLIRNLSVFTVIMLILVITIGTWMASYLSRRIIHLIQGISQFKSGDLQYRFTVDTQDEMGRLSDSFNTMANTIEEAVTKLKKQILIRKEVEKELEESNHNLEETVALRTHELQTTNEKLHNENEERKKAESRLKQMAEYDDLTGLANRIKFREKLVEATAIATREHSKFGLMFVDLDKFKAVNDNLGHDIGDKLLIRVADIFRSTTRAGDTIARLGGDEFALVINHVQNPEELSNTATRLIEELSTQMTIDERPLRIGASIGIAVYPDDSADAKEVLKHADIAMYRAKESGGNTFQFYFDELNSNIETEHQLENELIQSLENNEMQIHYQPIINTDTGEIVAAEALLRWNNPRLGQLDPMEFIPLAEEIELIKPLTQFVVENATKNLKRWHNMGSRHMLVSVNYSTALLDCADMSPFLSSTLESAGLSPDKLILELTEAAVMNSEQEPRQTEAIRNLRTIGLSLALDDFGSGYASFKRIKAMSLKTMKIDQKFIHAIGDPNDEAILRAMLIMLKELNFITLAEGVETEAQFNFLKAEGCELLQGFYFSKALPISEFDTLISYPLKIANSQARASK